MTKLGNATLFGNTSSLIFALWGLWIARRRPSVAQGRGIASRRDRRGPADGQQRRIVGPQRHRRHARAVRGHPLHRLSDRRAKGARRDPAAAAAVHCQRGRRIDASPGVAAPRRAHYPARLDLRPDPRAQQPGARPGPAGLCARLAVAAGRRPDPADPAGDLGLRRLDGLWRDGSRRSTGSARRRSRRRWSWSACPSPGLRGRLREASAVPHERGRVPSNGCGASSRSPSARMRCSTAGPRRRSNSAAKQLGIDPVAGAARHAQGPGGDDRPLHPGGRPGARSLGDAQAHREAQDPREDPHSDLAPAGDHGAGARSRAAGAGDPRHAAERPARACASGGAAPT